MLHLRQKFYNHQNLYLLIFGQLGADLAENYNGKLKVVKVNADENKEIVKENSISGLPTLLVFKDGQAVERMVGLMPKSTIVNNIEKHI